MTTTYEEFDTTPGGFITALKAKILLNPHWTDQGIVPVATTTTAATASAGTTITVASATGFVAGQYIIVNQGAAGERTHLLTGVSGSTLTISGTWGAVWASGATIRTRSNIVRSTSDRGAALILDLEQGSWDATVANYQGMAVYRQFTGTAPGAGGADAKFWTTYWKTAAGTTTMPIHVVLSVGKNHLFFSVEGPRPTEASTTSTTYGSIRNYFSLSDVIPYHASDTVPAVVLAASGYVGQATSTNNHVAQISRDSTNTYTWSNGRLASLDWPTMYTTDVVTMPRNCTIDGNTYLFPYVLFSEQEGLRGRLSSFFYCGTNGPSTLLDTPEPVGSKVTYGGVVYKLITISKGDGSQYVWGPFGAVLNNGAVTRSIVVAVPFADAV